MARKRIEVDKTGFLAVYPDLEEPRHSCRVRELVAVVLKLFTPRGAA